MESDPNARFVYSGAVRGVGAIMTWDGAIIGSGTQTITESRPNDYVGIGLNPGESGAARSWFELAPGVGTTIVTWGFEVDHGLNIVGRYFAPMLGGIVARDYYDGLEQLKVLAESLPSADFSDLKVEYIVVASSDIAYLTTSSGLLPAEIAESLGQAYFEILTFIREQGLTSDGAPLSIMRDFRGAAMVFDAAIPITGLGGSTARATTGVKVGKTYAGPVIRVTHTGSYRRLTDTHQKISAYIAALGLRRNGAAWESYVSDPGSVPENDLVTYIYYPVRDD